MTVLYEREGNCPEITLNYDSGCPKRNIVYDGAQHILYFNSIKNDLPEKC